MTLTRRGLIHAGGGVLLGLGCGAIAHAADASVEIAMQGRQDGSKVWFDPVGILVAPGATVRWTNRDPGNSHTTTAYSPELFDRPRRIPSGARPWNSDLLLPGQSFSVRLDEIGVYDYYCIPHEMAGMVGRIVVGRPDRDGKDSNADADSGLPEAAARGFPPVAEIMSRKEVRHS